MSAVGDGVLHLASTYTLSICVCCVVLCCVVDGCCMLFVFLCSSIHALYSVCGVLALFA